jgi:predicted RNase H-like nuclease
MIPMGEELFAGIDLAWSTGWTGVAVVDDSGRIQSSGRVRTDAEIAAWVQAVPGRLTVVAIDAPLVVPNETGQRLAERLIGRAYSAYGAAAHTSNRGTYGGREARAMTLARRFGWAVDPDAGPGQGRTRCIEVYPHPALVGLFELPYRVDYKKGATARRLPGFWSLVQLLESIPELGLDTYPRWAELRRDLADPRPGELNRWEDEVDAILCAHLAWLWQHRPGSLEVYGTVEEGYIVAPPAPTHRAVRPTPSGSGGAAGVVNENLERPRTSGSRPVPRHTGGARLGADTLALRILLIDRSQAGQGPVTYAQVADQVGRIPNGLRPVLDLLEQECARRGEPNLAVLVVKKATGTPTKYSSTDWEAAQECCRVYGWASDPNEEATK